MAQLHAGGIMTLVNWFDALWIGLPIACLVVTFGMRWTASPEERGCVLLKQKAAALGVDVKKIPDPAWDAIVELSIASARDWALCSRASTGHRAPDWQNNLAVTLEEEAVAVSRFMSGSACSGERVAPQVLIEFRV
jgi:hypothetical protein